MIDLEKPTAEERKPAAKKSASFRIHAFELQSAPPLADSQHYELEELVRYHDRLFVSQAFVAILKRPATKIELASTLDDLRTGRRTKIEILTDLTSAAPPSPQRVEISGLNPPDTKGIRNWPIVGRWLKILAAVIRLPVLMRDLQRFEVYSMAQQQRMADYLNEVLLLGQTDGTSGTLIDLLDTVSILSDSLIEMSAQIEKIQAQQAQLKLDLQTAINGHQEFLVQEQRIIVETQKVALGDLQTQIDDLLAQQKLKHDELASAVQELKGLLASGKATETVTARDQTPGASA